MLSSYLSNIRHALSLSIVLLLSGCASVSVKPSVSAPRNPMATPPRQIVVQPFAFPRPEAIRADRVGAEQAAFQRDLQARMQANLIAEMQKFGLPAVPGNGTPPPRPAAAWCLEGQFLRVNQGSRALRILIGMGAGGTKMETAARMLDLSTPVGKPPQVLFDLVTTGGSGAEPGLITSGGSGPVDVAVGMVLNVAGSTGKGVTEDTKRTARMIAAYVSEEVSARGYLDPRWVKKAKRLREN